MNTNPNTLKSTDSRCAAILPLLSEFIDGVLPSESAWQVQKHIAVCAACAQRAREMQQTVALLAALPSRPLSTNFDAALSARIAAARAQSNRSPWRRLIARVMPNPMLSPVGGVFRPVTGAITVAGLCAVLFACFALNQPLTPTIIKVPASVSASADSALVAACVNQQHATVANEPLSDPSAQMLDAQIDTESASPGPAASQSQGLSDADAVALVNETD